MTSISVDEYKRRLAKRPVKPRRVYDYAEQREQAQVVLWARARFDEDSDKWHDLDLLHCSLNGVKLSKAQAGKAKSQGMRTGIPDLFLPVPRKGFSGLFIEMKSETGRLSDAQKDVVPRLSALGYSMHVAYSGREAIEIIRTYYA